MKKLKIKSASSSLWFFMALLVLFRFVSTRPVYKNGETVRITSRVMQEPARYAFSQVISVAGLSVSLPLFPEVTYGDSVVVEGVVKDKKLVNGNLKMVIENRNWLYSFREKIIAFYQKSLPEPSASLVSGMVLGSKASIPEKFWEDLKNTGTAHVVVASGMNVSIVAGFLMGIMVLFLPRNRAIPFVLAGIVLYCVLSGLDAPIIRAAVMISVVFLAQETGRVASAWRALVLSAFIMLLVKPLWLVDLGFILSFVATASILLFQKRINNKLTFIPGVLKEGLSTSLAAQIGVGPILFVTFGQFNILSPVINALILWTVPLITVLGAVGGIIGIFVPLIGMLILYVTYPLTWWFATIVSISTIF
ncbi:MAG: ComEC/Rec2 family competence protein [bacterium]|nr:ComEC/Rec2 family competence protein [bacterium]